MRAHYKECLPCCNNAKNGFLSEKRAMATGLGLLGLPTVGLLVNICRLAREGVLLVGRFYLVSILPTCFDGTFTHDWMWSMLLAIYNDIDVTVPFIMLVQSLWTLAWINWMGLLGCITKEHALRTWSTVSKDDTVLALCLVIEAWRHAMLRNYLDWLVLSFLTASVDTSWMWFVLWHTQHCTVHVIHWCVHCLHFDNGATLPCWCQLANYYWLFDCMLGPMYVGRWSGTAHPMAMFPWRSDRMILLQCFCEPAFDSFICNCNQHWWLQMTLIHPIMLSWDLHAWHRMRGHAKTGPF